MDEQDFVFMEMDILISKKREEYFLSNFDDVRGVANHKPVSEAHKDIVVKVLQREENKEPSKVCLKLDLHMNHSFYDTLVSPKKGKSLSDLLYESQAGFCKGKTTVTTLDYDENFFYDPKVGNVVYFSDSITADKGNARVAKMVRKKIFNIAVQRTKEMLEEKERER